MKPTIQIPASLKLTVPLILLLFAAILSTVNLLYHVPQAERVAEEDSRKRLTQELSRLQSTLEYLLLKGDLAAAQHEIEVLAHNHDVIVAALTDDQDRVITATRRSWLKQPIAEVLPQFDLSHAGGAIRERRGGMSLGADGQSLLGYAGILLGGRQDELRPFRTGSLFLAYDLQRYKAEARTQVVQQSLLWAGWVTALAAAMWLVFHFLLTRRTARLVHAAEEFAAGNLAVRSRLRGPDELGRLGRAFDHMALVVAETQTRLRDDIAERRRTEEALRISEASYRAIFDAAEDVIFIHDIETGAIVDVNPKACSTFGYTRGEFQRLDLGALGSGVRPYTQRGRAGALRACGGRRAAPPRMAQPSQGRHAALARGVRQARDDRRPRPHPLARARRHRPQAGRGRARRERGAVPLDVQRVDRRSRALERGRRAGRHQPGAAPHVRLRRRRAGRAAPRRVAGTVVSARVPEHGAGRRVAARRGAGAAPRRQRDRARAARRADAVPGPAARADDHPRHHREEALVGRAGAPARVALPAREAGRARLAAGRRRARAEQPALGRRRARGAARGAGQCGDPPRGAEDPHRRRALRAHRAHVSRDGAPAAAAARAGRDQRRRVRRVRPRRLCGAQQQHRGPARARARPAAPARRRRPAAPGAAEPDHQCAAVAAGPFRRRAACT